MTVSYNPSIILKGGRVWTYDDSNPSAQAIAVAGSDIVAVGSDADVLALGGPNTEVVDLEGRVVVPGLADIHVHLCQDSLTAKAVEVRDFYDPNVKSIKDILGRIKERVAVTPPGKWIHAHGSPMQDDRLAEKRLPTKAELDSIAPDNPCYASFGAHVMVCNTAALKAVGVTRDTPDPAGGWIMRDTKGDPDGVLRERAQGPVRRMDDSKVASLEEGTEVFLKTAASRGLTVVHDIVTSGDAIRAYQALAEQGRLPVRVQLLVRIIESDITTKEMISLGLRQPFGSDMLKIGGSKMSIDGGFTARQAAYTGMKGLIRIDQQELDETVEACHMAGIRCCIHAIGDIAVDMALSAVERAQAKVFKPLRHRIEHMGNHLFTPERQARAKRIGALPIMNAAVFYFLGDMGASYVGPERNKSAFPWKTVQEAGFPIAGGSDATGYWPADSLRDLASMVNRTTFFGTVINAHEAIPYRDAIRAQTKDAAWVGFEEDRAGTITEGKIADICVLDRDPDTCPPEELATMPVKMTICAGKVTFRK